MKDNFDIGRECWLIWLNPWWWDHIRNTPHLAQRWTHMFRLWRTLSVNQCLCTGVFALHTQVAWLREEMMVEFQSDTFWSIVWSDGIPSKLFHVLKDDAVKVLHSICQQIWKTQQWPQDWKRSVFISIPKKGNAIKCSNYCAIVLISHSIKVMLKILQARLHQYVNHELPGVQAGFRKGRGTRDQIVNIYWIIEKAREFQKNIYFCFIDYAKAFDCVDHKTVENSSGDGNTRLPYLSPEKSVCRSGSNS